MTCLLIFNQRILYIPSYFAFPPIFHKSSGESNNLLTNRGHFAERKIALYPRIYDFMRALNYKALSFIYKVTDYTFVVLLWNCFFPQALTL